MKQPAPEVQAVVEEWRPTDWSERDLRTLERLLPAVRSWVEQSNPHDARQAAWYMSSAAGIARWAHGSLGTFDPAVVLHPRNVELYSMTVCAHRSIRWRERTRSTLRTLGRIVNPDDWLPPTRIVGKQKIARPYSAREEKTFRLASRLLGRDDRARRLWVVAAALGAGLSGVEIAAARTGDLVDIGNGRLAVGVPGTQPPPDTVPKGLHPPGRSSRRHDLYRAVHRQRCSQCCHWVTGRIDPGNGQGFSLRRARSTWLAAHLLAATPLAVLRTVAGPLSANTLDGLLVYAAASTDEETAVLGALGA